MGQLWQADVSSELGWQLRPFHSRQLYSQDLVMLVVLHTLLTSAPQSPDKP